MIQRTPATEPRLARSGTPAPTTKVPPVTRDPKLLLEIASLYFVDGELSQALMFTRLAATRIEAAIAGGNSDKFEQKAKRVIRKEALTSHA